ncbi:uncharacterized protein LOC114364448 [Ostrinia furnacalis]|uniref:uncharacterized protein LOC114364448 n=1 Tax=Ostrinia furnacalis TaxID=93504 RepID=UPI00103D5958|nr:uncharacterized protein LOC114364448 [Ostrinia furnacalis]
MRASRLSAALVAVLLVGAIQSELPKESASKKRIARKVLVKRTLVPKSARSLAAGAGSPDPLADARPDPDSARHMRSAAGTPSNVLGPLKIKSLFFERLARSDSIERQRYESNQIGDTNPQGPLKFTNFVIAPVKLPAPPPPPPSPPPPAPGLSPEYHQLLMKIQEVFPGFKSVGTDGNMLPIIILPVPVSSKEDPYSSRQQQLKYLPSSPAPPAPYTPPAPFTPRPPPPQPPAPTYDPLVPPPPSYSQQPHLSPQPLSPTYSPLPPPPPFSPRSHPPQQPPLQPQLPAPTYSPLPPPPPFTPRSQPPQQPQSPAPAYQSLPPPPPFSPRPQPPAQPLAPSYQSPPPNLSRPHVPPPPPFHHQNAAPQPEQNDPTPFTMPLKTLVEHFRAQTPQLPEQPAIVTRHLREAPPAPPRPAAAPLPGAPPAPPAPPRFERPLMLRGKLTVYRAGFSDNYVVWWDPASGSATTLLNQGAAAAHRVVDRGQVLRVTTLTDRSQGSEIRRCFVRQSSLSPEDLRMPVLPDTKDFYFHGYVQYGDKKAESWRFELHGQAGHYGAAPREALTFRHELLLQRAAAPLPLEYSVTVDSSLLGPAADSYVHRYLEAREEQLDHATNMTMSSSESMCDTTEEMEEGAELDEPLREYTLLARDPRHAGAAREFIGQYNREYANAEEEAVRYNVLMQSRRYVSSANRLGATFKTGVNNLSDRLDVEREQLTGARAGGAGADEAQRFPYSDAEVLDKARQLPVALDWNELGYVSPVRTQMNCQCCWALSTTDAVETALARRAGALRRLNPQAIVDCGARYGGNGCEPTWPVAAYTYMQREGVPYEEDYPPFADMELTCRRSAAPGVRIRGHANVTALNVDALKLAIHDYGPAVIMYDAGAYSFIFYKEGVYSDERCGNDPARRRYNHASLAVGFNSDARGEPYFIVKNSWGAHLQDRGYVRMAAAPNTCRMLDRPSIPLL